MTVYADLLFFVNFLFDAEILLILLKLSSRKIPVGRLVLSACMGGVQSIFAFVPYFRILCLPPARLAAAFVMAYTVLYPCRLRAALRGGAILLACAFALSGAVNFLHAKTVYAVLLPVPVYIILSAVKKETAKKYTEVLLEYGNKCVALEGFYDSGNMMTYNGTPVLLGSKKVFCSLFGAGFSINAVSEWVDARDLRIVPYTSLGGNGTALGVRLDRVTAGEHCFENAVLAYFDGKFENDLILNGIMT